MQEAAAGLDRAKGRRPARGGWRSAAPGVGWRRDSAERTPVIDAGRTEGLGGAKTPWCLRTAADGAGGGETDGGRWGGRIPGDEVLQKGSSHGRDLKRGSRRRGVSRGGRRGVGVVPPSCGERVGQAGDQAPEGLKVARRRTAAEGDRGGMVRLCSMHRLVRD